MDMLSRVIISKRDFKDRFDFVVAEQLKILLDAGNIIVSSYLDPSKEEVIIEYCNCDLDLKPQWLTSEEIEMLSDCKIKSTIVA